MTIKFMNRIAQGLARDRRVLASTLVVCVSMFLVGNAMNLYAQGNGAATMRTIPTFIGYEETFQWSDVPEILAQGTDSDQAMEYSWASDLFFQKEIWQLQFSYKNIRTIDVNFPTKDGKTVTKRVWYLIYSVKNTGVRLAAEVDAEHKADVSQKALNPKEDSATAGSEVAGDVFEFPFNNLKGVYKPVTRDYGDKPEEGSIKFVPRFVFASSSIQERLVYERKADGLFYGQNRGAEEGVYYDQFLPLAMTQIVKKEAREGQEFVDSVRMTGLSIKPGQTVWGVATWVDVDPRIDKFSIYISGLTNALRWEISEDEASEGETQVGAGRDVMRKVLKLNFFNPGDESHRGGKEIYNNLPGELDYQWVYL